MRILSEFKAEGWLPRKFGSCPLLLWCPCFPLSQPKETLISSGTNSGEDGVLFQQLPKPASPCLSTNASCLSVVLAASYTQQLISHQCCQYLGPRMATKHEALDPRLKGPDHASEVLLMDGQGGAAPFQMPPRSIYSWEAVSTLTLKFT